MGWFARHWAALRWWVVDLASGHTAVLLAALGHGQLSSQRPWRSPAHHAAPIQVGTWPQATEAGGLSAQWRTGGTSQRRLSPRKTPAYRDPAISHFLHSGTASAVAGPRLLPSPRPSPSPGPAVRSRRQRRFARWIGFLGGRRLPGSPPSAVTHTHNRAAHHTPHTTPPPPSQRERPQASEIFNYLVYPRGTVINPRLRPSLLHTRHGTSTQRARAATLRADNSTLDTIPTRPPSRRSDTASFLPC